MRRVICFGNDLHGDDGFGPAVYRRLAALDLPPGWRLYEAGSRGLDALALFEDCHEAVLVDAAAPDGCPGRIALPEPAEIAIESALPGHAAGVGYFLRALAALGGPVPAIRIVTAEMASLTPFRPGLSAAVERAADEAAVMVRSWMTGAAA